MGSRVVARPEDIQLAAGCLQMGIADAEHVAGYLGGDAEAVQIAEALAEKRGAFPTPAIADDALKARLAKLASHALCLGLTTPGLLATAFAAWPDGKEVADIAIGLGRKQLAKEGRRRPPWEPAPPPRVLEIDPVNGLPLGTRLAPAGVEVRPPSDLLACSRGAHAYGPVDPETGWSRCLSCGYTLVVDRRHGPGSLLPGITEFSRG